MIADRRVLAVIAPLHSLRCLRHVKRSLIGPLYDHAANMNSESEKELLKLQNSELACRPVFLCSSGGKFCEFS